MNHADEKPSTILPKPTRKRNYQWTDGSLGFECDIGPYQCCLKWNWGGAEPRVQGQSFAMIQVCRADGGSVFDWRHLQQIKNIMLDPEWEAVEIFPAESRLKDPSNARYLWASAACYNHAPALIRVAEAAESGDKAKIESALAELRGIK